MSKPEYDFETMMKERGNRARWSAERENASARLTLADLRERMAEVLSQHEPVAGLGIDRDKLRVIIDYIRSGRI